MSLSPMQEIFILLEDEKEVPYYRLTRWGRSARGVLAKLKNLGHIEKIEKDKELYYKITETGEDYFDNVLSYLKSTRAWDKKWRLVMFEIPETDRALRDKLRRQLANLGMGLLQSSVWITPKNVEKEIEEINNDLELSLKLKVFEVKSTPILNQQIIDKALNNPILKIELERFTREAERALKAMGKAGSDQFNAKKLIFEYASILKKGPQLPQEFVIQNETLKKCNEIYLKLRKFAI